VEAQGVDRTERDREHDPIETRKGWRPFVRRGYSHRAASIGD
jgi:hypothetical protein